MFGLSENSLWVEKYRPKNLEDYVASKSVKEKINLYLQNQDVPHLLLYGPPGTGKTTLAKIIAGKLDCDLLYLNASDENSVDTIRDKVKSFASQVGFRTWRIIILDEADYMTPNAQAILRNIMESFSTTTRFILTCNHVEKIHDAIYSRCQPFEIRPLSKEEVAERLVNILDSESVKYELEDIAVLVNKSYPDIRRIINSAASYSSKGFLKLDSASILEANYIDKIIEVLKNLGAASKMKQTFETIRQLIADSGVRDFSDLYTGLYSRIDEFAKGHIGPVILILSEAQYRDSFSVDKEINVMAMFVQLLQELYS